MHPDPWPEAERLAVDRGLDLSSARQLLADAKEDGRFIDPETALGNTLLTTLRLGGSVEDAVRHTRAETNAALEKGTNPPTG